MKYSVNSGSAASHKVACLVVGVFTKGKLSETAEQCDTASGGYLKKLLKHGDFSGNIGQTQMLYDVPNLKATRVLLVGCGAAKSELSDSQFKKLAHAAHSVLIGSGAKDVLNCLADVSVTHRDLFWKTRQLVESLENALYTFETLKSKKTAKPSLKEMSLAIPSAGTKARCINAISEGQAIAAGVSVAKTLGDLPANVCTPSYLAKEARALSKTYKSIKTSILEEAAMKKLGMNALLSVSNGSSQPAKLITMQYKGTKATAKPIVLVGKGITFDSGGISMKPAAGMDEMKFDMCGAASVFGTMNAIAKLELPINVTAVVAASENLPSGNATKPGDVVKSMSGQTIEILNTDAEGRLVLSDALTYCEKFNPDVVIDIATLTGAMVVALGAHATGIMGNNDRLVHNLVKAGEDSSDRAWQFPMWDEYQETLASNFADMGNIGAGGGGSITAACFLSRFTKKYQWAHMDIAGTAWKSGKAKGATGRPVGLLTQYIINRSKTK